MLTPNEGWPARGDAIGYPCEFAILARSQDTASATVLVDLAIEALQDIITTADLLQQAIVAEAAPGEIQKLRDTAKSQFEAYLDLKERAAVAALKLKP